MKSRVKENIAKKASESLITWETVDESVKRAHLSYLAQTAVLSQLDERLHIDEWLFNGKTKLWTINGKTAGGSVFSYEGTDMKSVIESANSYFKNFSDNT